MVLPVSFSGSLILKCPCNFAFAECAAIVGGQHPPQNRKMLRRPFQGKSMFNKRLTCKKGSAWSFPHLRPRQQPGSEAGEASPRAQKKSRGSGGSQEFNREASNRAAPTTR